MQRCIVPKKRITGVGSLGKVLCLGAGFAHISEICGVAHDPDKASDRSKRDAAWRPEVKRVFEENLEVYGAR